MLAAVISCALLAFHSSLLSFPFISFLASLLQWGYSGPQYASQLGVQNAAIKGVVDSLSGHAVMPPINNNNSGKSLSEFEAKVVSSKSHSKNKRSKGERSRKLAEAAAEAESGNGRALKF